MKKMQEKQEEEGMENRKTERALMHGDKEKGSSIHTYQNKEGERVFRIMDIVGVAQNEPRDLAGIMRVKSVSEEGLREEREECAEEEEKKEEKNQELPSVLDTWIKNCLVCNVPLSDNSFSVFCSKCLIIEDSNLYNAI